MNSVDWNCAHPPIPNFFQLAHSVQTRIVQGSAGSWESKYVESRLSLCVDFQLYGRSAPLTPTLFNCTHSVPGAVLSIGHIVSYLTLPVTQRGREYCPTLQMRHRKVKYLIKSHTTRKHRGSPQTQAACLHALNYSHRYQKLLRFIGQQ